MGSQVRGNSIDIIAIDEAVEDVWVLGRDASEFAKWLTAESDGPLLIHGGYDATAV